MKENSRRASWRGNRFPIIVGCLCLWLVLAAFTARDFLTCKDGAIVSKEHSYQSFVSSSLKTSIPNSHTEHSTNITANKNNETNEDEIRGLFDRWNDALLTGDPRAVADLYLSDKMSIDGKTKKEDSELMLLLPTLSNEPRTNLSGVEDYFVAFLKRKPEGRIVSGKIIIGPDGSWAHDAGIYEFVLEGNVNPDTQKSKTTTVLVRYSFLYLRDERGEWKIAHHHSSLMPES